jgi:transmembrane sensor
MFDVGILGDGAAVTLESGKVDVTIDGGTRSIVLEPGERVRFGQHGAGPVEKVKLDDALAWRGGRYIFYRARLSDVVAEIGRYRRGRILIASNSLGDQLVTGSFMLADTDAALTSLQASVGFRITSLTGALTVISP